MLQRQESLSLQSQRRTALVPATGEPPPHFLAVSQGKGSVSYRAFPRVLTKARAVPSLCAFSLGPVLAVSLEVRVDHPVQQPGRLGPQRKTAEEDKKRLMGRGGQAAAVGCCLFRVYEGGADDPCGVVLVLVLDLKGSGREAVGRVEEGRRWEGRGEAVERGRRRVSRTMKAALSQPQSEEIRANMVEDGPHLLHRLCRTMNAAMWSMSLSSCPTTPSTPRMHISSSPAPPPPAPPPPAVKTAHPRSPKRPLR